MALETRLRRWGNSIGIVIPTELLRQKNLKEGEEIVIEIEKKEPISKIFGSLKNWKKSSQKMKDEIRKEEHKNG